MDNQEAIRLMRNLPTMCEFTDAYGEPIDSDAYYEAVDIAISALHAQDAPDINVGSMISRQDAIDRINEYIEEYSEIDSDGNHSEKWCAMAEAKMVIENLPSVQPEIIRCKDCRWRKDQSGSTAWLPCRAIVTPSDFYCGRAERRTDELGNS